jgi:type IV pilus assembly protein PilE
MRDYKMKSSGFTLIELVIAIVIAAILAAIAIPSYSNYVRKARRTEAKTVLLDMASLEERYFSTNNQYSQTPADLGYSGAFPIISSTGYYSIAISNFNAATPLNPATYTLTATAVSTTDQAKDATCQTFSVTQSGVQAATPDTTPPTCWTR